MTNLEQQVIDAAVRLVGVRRRPPGAPIKHEERAALAMLDRSVAALEAEQEQRAELRARTAKVRVDLLHRFEGYCSRCGGWMEIITESPVVGPGAWVCSVHVGESS